MRPDVIGVLFGLIPGERCAERQETHGAEERGGLHRDSTPVSGEEGRYSGEEKMR